MINLMVKAIFDNSNKIDSIAKYINKSNKRTCLQVLLLTTTICIITSAVKSQEERINNLETELEVIKSKLA